MQDVVIVGIPLLAILAGIFFGRSDIKDLRTEMNTRFEEITNRFNNVEDHFGRIAADFRQFYHLTGKLEARMDSFEKRG